MQHESMSCEEKVSEGNEHHTTPSALCSAHTPNTSATPSEGVLHLISRFLDAESFARRNVELLWFRHLSIIKGEAEKAEGLISSLKANGLGREDPFDEQMKRNGVDLKANRAIGEFLFKEYQARMSTQQEEDACFDVLCLCIHEMAERAGMAEESATLSELMLNALKPKFLFRYDFAWDVVRAICTRPSVFDKERFQCSDRHKPPAWRLPPITCPIPIMPNTDSYLTEGRSPVAMLTFGPPQ